MMNRHIIIGLLLSLFFGLGTLNAKGEVVDSLSADITESEWKDSVVVEFEGSKNTTSIEYASKQSSLCNVYDLRGRIVRKRVHWDVVRKELPSGVYIIAGKKVVIK